MNIGAFYAKETVLFCPHDKKNFFSDQLRSLVPRGGTFGFDVIVEVGLAICFVALMRFPSWCLTLSKFLQRKRSSLFHFFNVSRSGGFHLPLSLSTRFGKRFDAG